ncbi:enoyl-CoA hydratase/isomerase family protein [Caulobacter sp. S45]|uniref:enoyl-CoA hydratase/isomerase family protein n=1 Tax=Caulobacter sp. S45 TaxID=1641861 RepID=UPI0015761677|nr:enoyl-CoA hydratase/isomerase family protein [Caulobacter sp. S45]
MTASDGDGVSLQVRGPVATLVLDRPHKRNAMRLRTWRALPALIAAAEREAAVGLVLVRGAGGHFGAGNDIAEFGALRSDAAAAAAYGRAMADAMHAVEAASKPVVMAIEGVCYGASLALVLAGDLRLATQDASFAITPAKLGALYLRSDLHRLAAAVGPARSKRLIYTAEAIGASEALDIGLVDELLPSDRFELELSRRMGVILEGSPFTLRQTKAMLRSLGHGRAPVETEESLASFVEATQGDDFKEGVEAFLNRRPPRFR